MHPLVLAGSGSVSSSLFIWASCGFLAISGTYCWLELGLTLPIHSVRQEGKIQRVLTPRSGGEKSFLEYIYKKPPFFITSVYGILFLILGNISGNAVAFGMYVLIAAGYDPINADPQRARVYGIAVGLLTFCAAFHVFSRRGGIILSNVTATIKGTMLVAIAILGLVHADKKYLQQDPDNHINLPNSPKSFTGAKINDGARENLPPSVSFDGQRADLGSSVTSFLFVLFSYNGFDQPFYVLSEVKRPRKVFPTYTVFAMALSTFLYVLSMLPTCVWYPRKPSLTRTVRTK